MAGLLTDSFFSYIFPICSVVWGIISENSSGASQQRDCSGFAPDSLLIRKPERASETNSGTKVEKTFESVLFLDRK